MKQQTFASLAYDNKKKKTRKEIFLEEMDRVLPWEELLAPILKVFPKGEKGRQPFPASTMLRIYFLQQWFNLSDPAMEDALYDVESMRRFAGLTLGEDYIPDESTILKFRHFLEKKELVGKMFVVVDEHLVERGLRLSKGTIVDATIINAPSSTKNANKERDPEMSSTKKGNNWYFGMKMHVGTDTNGIIHNVAVTEAAMHDSQVFDELLHGEEEVIYGDKAYADETKKQEFEEAGGTWRVHKKAKSNRKLNGGEQRFNRKSSRIRSLVEHGFNTIKNLWGHRKTRYRGLDKNLAQFGTLAMLSNLYRLRKKLA
jgi:IS5 family transposase